MREVRRKACQSAFGSTKERFVMPSLLWKTYPIVTAQVTTTDGSSVLDSTVRGGLRWCIATSNFAIVGPPGQEWA